MLRRSRLGEIGRHARPVVLLVGVLVAAACHPRPRVPYGVPPAPAPFERLPYLQAVGADSAVVRWRVEADAASEVGVRAAGAERWREAEVEELEGGDRRAVLESAVPGEALEFVVEASRRGARCRSGPHRFHTAPPERSGAPIRLLGFGDSGWGSEAQISLAEGMKGRDWDLSLHVGDIAYDDGTERDFTQRHFRVYGELFARAPFFPVPGNHDLVTGGRPYDRAFDWPGERPGRRFYRFRWGRALFVGLDTSSEGQAEALAHREGPQYEWLEETLREAAADTTVRWTVVFTHYPLYSHGAGLGAHGPAEGIRAALEPLLLRHGVDLVLAGHEHHYERTHPLRDGRRVEPGCGPVHVIIGGGGASRFARAVAPEAHAARVSRAHHFLDLTIRGSSVLGRAVGTDGREIDRFRLFPYDPEGDAEGRCGG